MDNKSKPKRNIYTHEIDLTPLTIKNQERDGVVMEEGIYGIE